MTVNNKSLYYPLIDSTIKLCHVQFVDNHRDLESFIAEDFDRDFSCKHAPKVGSPKLYTYKYEVGNGNYDLCEGDLVVVETGSRYSVAVVKKIDVPLDMNIKRSIRWVAARIPLEAHKERLQFERDLIDNVETMRTSNMRLQLIAALGVSQDEAVGLLTTLRDKTDSDKT